MLEETRGTKKNEKKYILSTKIRVEKVFREKCQDKLYIHQPCVRRAKNVKSRQSVKSKF